MVDFSRKLKNKSTPLIDNPIKIYELLDRQSDKVGSLRHTQEVVLSKWYSNLQDQKDVILKMNTGSGKTLVGLLMLESKRRKNKKLEVFLCNNNNLIAQTVSQASSFGITTTTIDENNSIPIEAQSGEKILVTSVQKLFNGRSIFKKDDVVVDTIVIDDAHSSAEIIKNAATITITKQHNSQLYADLFHLLEEDIRSQGTGTFEEIKNYNAKSKNENPFILIPYWAWIDKIEEITSLLAKRISIPKSDTGLNEIYFSWPLIKDSLDLCSCVVSGTAFEISPIKYPINEFSSYTNANQRIFMSATTASDSVLINDLDLSSSTVLSPLFDPNEKWSGEKMVIIPNLISSFLDRSTIVSKFAPPASRPYGITAIVPSFYRTADWEKYGALHGYPSNALNDALKEMKMPKKEKTLLLVNRYDGVDLPDDDTRILIIDSLPNSSSLHEKYIDSVIPNGSEVLVRRAQKIEQAMGRSVRADTDYSVILFIDDELVRFIRNPENQQYFSKQVTRQIELGIDISQDVKNEIQNVTDLLGKDDSIEYAFSEMLKLINQSINRDPNWKEYYYEQMNSVNYNNITEKNEDIEIIEQKANFLQMAFSRDTDINQFNESINEFIDNSSLNDEERGWYLQLTGRVNYYHSKSKSFNYQKSAYQKNNKLLLPPDFNPVNKLSPLIEQSRLENIIKQIRSYQSFEYFSNAVSDISSHLTFGTPSKKFEYSFDELGKILGFITDRPDEKYKAGPDHLWSVNDNLYFIFEDKSEIKPTREKINKQETGQMNNSIAWFKLNYHNSEYQAFEVIPTNYVDPAGGFSENVRIVHKKALKNLRKNFEGFCQEFCDLDFQSLSPNQINSFLQLHDLNVDNFANDYSVQYH